MGTSVRQIRHHSTLKLRSEVGEGVADLVVVLGFALETEEAADTHLDVSSTVRVVRVDLGAVLRAILPADQQDFDGFFYKKDLSSLYRDNLRHNVDGRDQAIYTFSGDFCKQRTVSVSSAGPHTLGHSV